MLALALAALLAALVPGPALADDACLIGDSTLGDWRALAALTVATESACPCEQAPSAHSWKRCARQTLNDAVGTGALREACERTAKQTVRGTSCGGRKVTCGAVARGGGDPTCKLTGAKGCRDSRRADRTACTEQTSCADVVSWTAGTCDDPRDEGAYTPGVRVMSWTKDSASSPGTPRTLDTVVWYPAPKGSGPVDTGYGAVVEAPVAEGGPYPVVLFSHGSCGYPLQSLFLTPLLASRGFIVVAPPHPGNTINEFPNCGTAANQAAAFIDRPRDMVFVLDQILAASADPMSAFFGSADPARVAMTGHSFGGLTTYLVPPIDSRIKAAVAMAPATLAANKLTIPSLVMLGTIDSVVNNPNARTVWQNSSSPKWLVEIEHAGHDAFSNLCFPGPDCNPPTTLTQDEAHGFAVRWIVPFLERYLAGHADADPLLDPPTGPGVIYQAGQ